jgi:hypothetical protein
MLSKLATIEMFCGLRPLKYGFIADRQCTRLALRDRRRAASPLIWNAPIGCRAHSGCRRLKRGTRHFGRSLQKDAAGTGN